MADENEKNMRQKAKDFWNEMYKSDKFKEKCYFFKRNNNVWVRVDLYINRSCIADRTYVTEVDGKDVPSCFLEFWRKEMELVNDHQTPSDQSSTIPSSPIVRSNSGQDKNKSQSANTTTESSTNTTLVNEKFGHSKSKDTSAIKTVSTSQKIAKTTEIHNQQSMSEQSSSQVFQKSSSNFPTTSSQKRQNEESSSQGDHSSDKRPIKKVKSAIMRPSREEPNLRQKKKLNDLYELKCRIMLEVCEEVEMGSVSTNYSTKGKKLSLTKETDTNQFFPRESLVIDEEQKEYFAKIEDLTATLEYEGKPFYNIAKFVMATSVKRTVKFDQNGNCIFCNVHNVEQRGPHVEECPLNHCICAKCYVMQKLYDSE